MIDLVFATNNSHKISEIKRILPSKFNLMTLADINCSVEIPEEQETIEENSVQKSKYIFDNYKIDCFADDTGLEVEALNARPGVHSARYAGEDRDFEANIDKLLNELHNITNRNARFVTVISLIFKGELFIFKGIVKGNIIEKRKGKGGFGYDSVFMPEGYSMTFAEMTTEEKNNISHRGIAVKKLVEFLETI
jgi:XTP/dITP diphosphohydrolase